MFCRNPPSSWKTTFSAVFVLVSLCGVTSCSGSSADLIAPPLATTTADSGSGEEAPPAKEIDSGVGSPVDPSNCQSPANVTAAAHIKLSVSWDGSTFLEQGSGTSDVWLLAKYEVKDGMIAGTVRTCGITLPTVSSTLLAGNRKVQLVFADNWDVPTMPTFVMKGSQTGIDTDSVLRIDPTTGAFGFVASSKYLDPKTPWPATGNSFPHFESKELLDSDGTDGPGITLSASTANGHSLLPTSADFITNPTADRVSVVARNTVALTGKATKCGEFAGSAAVTLFENHIVGCHDKSGENCAKNPTGTNAGPGFLDSHRTLLKPGNATFTAKILSEGSTCAQARAALP